MKVLSVFVWPLLIILGLLVLLSAYLYFAQDRMVFYPSREYAITPDHVGMQYENVMLNVGDNDTVHAWYIPHSNGKATSERVVIILCHGNAGNISHRLETAEFALDIGADILLWDYRGYGQSTGSPSEENLYSDAGAFFDWLVDDKGYRPQNIISFGRSLGGAVAVDLATKVDCRALVMESSFTSAAAMGKRMYPFLPTGWLLRFEFNSLEKIADVSVPVLVTHSPHDEIIPYEMGRALYKAASEPKRFVELSGGHNDHRYMSDPEYRQAWLSLINKER